MGFGVISILLAMWIKLLWAKVFKGLFETQLIVWVYNRYLFFFQDIYWQTGPHTEAAGERSKIVDLWAEPLKDWKDLIGDEGKWDAAVVCNIGKMDLSKKIRFEMLQIRDLARCELIRKLILTQQKNTLCFPKTCSLMLYIVLLQRQWIPVTKGNQTGGWDHRWRAVGRDTLSWMK